MASVQHFLCDAGNFPLHIIAKHAALEGIEKDRHFAALKIQRLWRGYVVRKEIARWHQAATVLQRFIRGFLLRWHLPEILQAYVDWYRQRHYNRMATKIQALWRGYQVRKNRVPIKELMAARQRIENANADIQRKMREAFRNMEKSLYDELEKEAKQWVLYILFKLHHLVRTGAQEGVYSIHGKTELSCIEHWLKALPLQEYMQELKEVYYKAIRAGKAPHPYTFKSKRLQKVEDMYRNRDRTRETKHKFVPDRNIHKQSFNLLATSLIKQYEREMLRVGSYPSQKFELGRVTDKTKQVSKKDFDLYVHKKTDIKPQISPYYIDFWSKICELHNLPDL